MTRSDTADSCRPMPALSNGPAQLSPYIDVLVTTGGADPQTLQLCRQAGGQVITAQ